MSNSLQQAEEDQGGAERQQLRALRAEPALPCTAQHLHINRAGTYALVYGHMASAEVTTTFRGNRSDAHARWLACSWEIDIPEVVTPWRGAQTQEDGLPALHVISLTQRDDDAAAVPLDDVQLVDRPGLQILQAAWHPGSDAHFAVLGSDNVFRLYHIDDLSAPVSRAVGYAQHPIAPCQHSQAKSYIVGCLPDGVGAAGRAAAAGAAAAGAHRHGGQPGGCVCIWLAAHVVRQRLCTRLGHRQPACCEPRLQLGFCVCAGSGFRWYSHVQMGGPLCWCPSSPLVSVLSSASDAALVQQRSLPDVHT
jgi:hypothetical protein